MQRRSHVLFMTRARRSLRLSGYDYCCPNAYFFTACTQNRDCIFGRVREGRMCLNEFGMIVRECWNELPDHFANVVLDEFQIMPNHVHGIFWIVDRRSDASSMAPIPFVGMTHASSLQNRIVFSRTDNPESLPARGPRSGSVGAIVGSFKSAAARRINRARYLPGASVWQYNFHERIIRTQTSLGRIRRYIGNNPRNWHQDRNHHDG